MPLWTQSLQCFYLFKLILWCLWLIAGCEWWMIEKCAYKGTWRVGSRDSSPIANLQLKWKRKICKTWKFSLTLKLHFNSTRKIVKKQAKQRWKNSIKLNNTFVVTWLSVQYVVHLREGEWKFEINLCDEQIASFILNPFLRIPSAVNMRIVIKV